ncbi:MAG: ATP-binding protein [Phycisphaerae bacterium]|nr:ATP-binding protein [Phycisphaerae bacterium]
MTTLLPSAGRQFSLRWRVTASIVLLTALMQLTLGIVVGLYQEDSTERLFNTRIGVRLDDIAHRIEALDHVITSADLERIQTEAVRFVLFEQVALALYHEDGTLVASSAEPPPLPQSIIAGALATSASQFVAPVEPLQLDPDHPPMPTRFGVKRVTIADGSVAVLCLGAGDRYAREFIASTTRLLVVSILGSLIATVVATWLIVGRVLQPLMRLGTLATRLQPEQLERDDDLPGDRIHELESLRIELASARERLRRAFAAQDRFLSNVSHELKTPIAVLLTEVQTLNHASLGPAGEELAISVSEEMRRLGAMIESFLLLTRVGVGKAAPADHRFSLVEPVIEAVASCQSLARQHGVALVPTIDPTLSLDDEVVGDPTLIRIMVEGLLRNALRFSPSGGSIALQLSRGAGSDALIGVLDQGPGIPVEIKDSLFDRFVQARSEHERGRGSGLGLSIAQGIAEMHGGRIWFENGEQCGCTFFVRLPVARLGKP